MKIALFHNLPSGGAKRHTYEQLKEMAKREHTIVEYAPATADLEYCSFAPFVKEQRIYQASEISLTKKRIPFVTPYIHAIQLVSHLRQTERINLKIAREINAESYDIILAKDCQIISNPYLLRFVSAKSVFQCHHGGRPGFDRDRKQSTRSQSLSHKLKQAYYYPAHSIVDRRFQHDETMNIRAATKVLTNSRYSESVLQELYGIQSQAIYPGINTQLFYPQDLPEKEYVLSVGSLIYSKGHRFLVSALALIDQARRPTLCIAANSRNPNEEEALRKMAREANVDLHIETIFDAERLVKVYNQAKVFVYAPLQEALGMAPLEAMACGTPVVAVAEGGVRETVHDGETGYLVTRDAHAFAEKLEYLLTHERERRCLGQAGVDYVCRQWTWPKAVDKLEQELMLVANA